ncbi:hypothetical protein TcasGA2_TC033482 [Tribolium castaneum]|uniref:Uncharacterized protein n=1 Tax=Tribolium castaneum TaxID=7070 RepID=A0A139WGD5_TRICA|nr:hypothetical protein TcasGA2_TC033482 [Tribolium castaneum]
MPLPSPDLFNVAEPSICNLCELGNGFTDSLFTTSKLMQSVNRKYFLLKALKTHLEKSTKLVTDSGKEFDKHRQPATANGSEIKLSKRCRSYVVDKMAAPESSESSTEDI